jgi:hypothetical protein
MRTIKSLDYGTMLVYGAVVAALWTLVFGIIYWLLGWAFGAQSWLIDMNLGLWTEYTLETALTVLWRMIVNGIGGAIAGLIIAVVYNMVAGIMGGIKIEMD